MEDLSFPKAYVSAAMVAFGAIGGVDTDVGDEKEELARRQERDDQGREKRVQARGIFEF